MKYWLSDEWWIPRHEAKQLFKLSDAQLDEAVRLNLVRKQQGFNPHSETSFDLLSLMDLERDVERLRKLQPTQPKMELF